MTFSTISAIDYNGRSISTRNCLMPEGPVINYREDQGGGTKGGGVKFYPHKRGTVLAMLKGREAQEVLRKSEPRDIL